MPGKVVELLCQLGDKVQSGQQVLVLEAMKIRNAITAPSDGTVTDLQVGVGDSVAEDQPLFTLGT